MQEFELTKSVADSFMSAFVAKLNSHYKNIIINGYYSRKFYSFSYQVGKHFPAPLEIDIEKNYFLFNLKFIAKFNTGVYEEEKEENRSLALPKNALDFDNIKLEQLTNCFDVKKFFIKFMFKVFGESYKNAILKIKNNEYIKLKQKYEKNLENFKTGINFIKNL